MTATHAILDHVVIVVVVFGSVIEGSGIGRAACAPSMLAYPMPAHGSIATLCLANGCHTVRDRALGGPRAPLDCAQARFLPTAAARHRTRLCRACGRFALVPAAGDLRAAKNTRAAARKTGFPRSALAPHPRRAVFERYNIVSGRDLKDAASKLETYLAVQNGDKTGTIAPSEKNEVDGPVEKVQ